MNRLSKTACLFAAIAILVACATAAFAQTTIYSESFTNANATALNGLAPTMSYSPTAWVSCALNSIESDQAYVSGGDRNSYLGFTP